MTTSSFPFGVGPENQIDAEVAQGIGDPIETARIAIDPARWASARLKRATAAEIAKLPVVAQMLPTRWQREQSPFGPQSTATLVATPG